LYSSRSDFCRRSNKPIQELTTTPILLSLTCAVFHQTGKFYSKRSQLYEEGLELLLEQWDKSREIDRGDIYRDLSSERKLDLLSFLAVKKFEQEQYVLFEQEEIEEYISEFLGIGKRESRAVLRSIESQHGLLIERSQKIWSFSHLTFQEYLTAKYLFSFDQVIIKDKLNKHIKCPAWREIFLLFATMDSCADNLILLIVENINKIAASQHKIQFFLDWVNKRSVELTIEKYSCTSPEDVFLYRIFYFVNELAINLAANEKINVKDRIFSMVLSTDHLDIVNSFYPGEGWLEFGSEIDKSLTDVYVHTSLNIFSEINSKKHFPVQSLEDIYVYSTYAIDEDDNGFYQQLQDLQKKLPVNKDRENWSDGSRLEWVEDLRGVMIEYRNIGNNWYFQQHEVDAIRDYYYVSKLLISCLNCNFLVGGNINIEIAEMLFLPIAEIEKRKVKVSTES
jgi:hypothetical protein